jgi:regulator of replication initiation timing
MELVREENGRLREENSRLKAAVQRNLGQELDRLGTADLTARVDELVGDNQQLNRDLAQAQERVRVLEAQLAETQDDLAAVRASLRKMIKEGRPLTDCGLGEQWNSGWR